MQVFVHGVTGPTGPGPPHYRGFAIKLRHATLRRTPLDEWSARRRDLYLKAHETHQETDIPTPGGIRTRIPSKQSAVNARLRPRGLLT